MRVGKCSECGNVGSITPVLNPEGLCSKCWMLDRKEKKSNKEEKVLFYIFLLTYEQGHEDVDTWEFYIKKFHSLDVDWWVKPMGASHIGLAFQSILDTNDIDEAERISQYISDQYSGDCLIVLHKGMVSRIEPVGENNEKVFWEPGRYFDKLVSKNKKGIYII